LSAIALLGLLTASANAGVLYATRNGTTLYEVDTSDASLTTVETYSSGLDGEAIAYHPDSGNLYRWTGNVEITSSTIDPSNSFTESVLSTDSPANEVFSSTWNPSANNFFMTARFGFWRTMSANGNFSSEASIESDLWIRGVAFVGSTLYALEHAGTLDSGVVDLLTLDPATGDILSDVDIDVPGYSDDGAFGLAYDPDTDTLYAALGTSGDQSGRFLATIDPTTGEGTAVGSFTTDGINSLAVIPVPEPTTLALACAGAILTLRRKR